MIVTTELPSTWVNESNFTRAPLAEGIRKRETTVPSCSMIAMISATRGAAPGVVRSCQWRPTMSSPRNCLAAGFASRMRPSRGRNEHAPTPRPPTTAHHPAGPTPHRGRCTTQPARRRATVPELAPVERDGGGAVPAPVPALDARDPLLVRHAPETRRPSRDGMQDRADTFSCHVVRFCQNAGPLRINMRVTVRRDVTARTGGPRPENPR